VPDQINPNATTFGTMAPALMQDFPEVLSASRIRRSESVVSCDNHLYHERNFFFADPEFFDVFTFHLISGDPKKAISEPFSVLITQNIAEKYFGNENPVGKILLIDNKYDYKITGVLMNPPANTHFKFDFLASFVSLNNIWGENTISWMNTKLIMTYVKLQKNYNPNDLERKFPSFTRKYMSEDSLIQFSLQPLTSIHLHSHIDNELAANSDIRYVYIFSTIALLIMLVACFNYMNLSTSRFACRSKEIRVRKVLGAERKQIIMQFMGESMILTIISLVISIFLVKAFLPVFNSLIDRDLNFTFLSDRMTLFGLFGLIILVGFISGSYPALFFSSFQPVRIVKGLAVHKSSSAYRKYLFIFQFVVSIILFICTLTIYRQIVYIKNRDLGFNKEQVLIVDVRDENLQNNYEPLRNELSQFAQIFGTSVSTDIVAEINALNGGFQWEGYNEDDGSRLFFTTFVDFEFLDFFDIELVKGRNFSKEYPSDVNQAYILNETAVKTIGWQNPIGKKFGYGMDGKVIGLIKDFHHLSLHSMIGPTILMHESKWAGIKIKYLFIKINSKEIPRTLAYIEDKFKKYSLHYPFSYSFLDERVNRKYMTENKIGLILNYFSFIAIFIACLGLFGLVTFLAEQRTKEIGIRKVIGATVSSIVFQFSKSFIKWILVSNFIAWPIAYFAMNSWLNSFAYRTNIGIAVFIVSGLSAFALALITVSYKLIKAATANPVDSLRYE
jgi:putative ABC transport system permease protein